jgi:alginate O-acetyltransferase complex protein AlgJ
MIFAALAVVFFGAPLTLRLVGVRAQASENRRLAAAPSLSDGWSFFNEATRYLIDRLPLRGPAVRANTWIDLHILATTPQYGLNGLGGVANDQALASFTGSAAQDKAALAAGAGAGKPVKGGSPPPPTASQVVVGRDGWLFLRGVFYRACAPFIPFGTAARRWEELLSVIRQSGRKAILVVPPDKSTIYPEYVASDTPDLSCWMAGTQALWKVIESPVAAQAGIVGLRQPLLAMKRTSRDLLYYKTDSHWNSVGELTMVETVVPLLDPTIHVLPSEIAPARHFRFGGDLDNLLGVSLTEIAPGVGIQRAPGAPVITAPAVIVGDSYADVSMPEIAPYFGALKPLEYWVENTPQQIATAIASSRDVVLETVEREFDFRATDGAYITPAFIALVRRTLAAHPLH